MAPRLIELHRSHGDWVPEVPIGVVMIVQNVHDMYRITVLFGTIYHVYFPHELELVSAA